MRTRSPEYRVTHTIQIGETRGILFKRTTLTVPGLTVEGEIVVPTKKIPDVSSGELRWASINYRAKTGREVKPTNFQLMKSTTSN
jgi:hypothetical protein